MPISRQTSALAVVASLVAGTAFGGAWTLYDEKASSTVAVLTSCTRHGVCTTPLNLNGDVNAGTAQPVVDLVIGGDLTPIRIYLGTGEDGRGFSPSFDIVDSASPSRTTGLKFADIDNDGDVEMIRTTRGSGNSIYRFRNPAPPFFCQGVGPCVDTQDVWLGGEMATDSSHGLAVGDIDLDCRIDVIVANGVAGSGDQSNKVYMNTTAGIIQGADGCPAIAPNANAITFGPAIALPSTGVGGVDSDSRRVELADVDADGDLDAIVANADANDNWLYLNQLRPITIPPPATIFAAPVPLTASPGDDAELSLGLAIGDINGDGATDVAVANSNNANRYYLNANATVAETARFGTSGTFGSPTDSSNNVVLGDVNRDGFLDAVVTNDPGPSRVHLLQGDAGAFADYAIEVPTGLPGDTPLNVSAARGLDLGKLDNDDSPDLVIANTNNQYDLRFLNNGSCFQSNGQPLSCNPFANIAPTIASATTPPVMGNEDMPLAITIANVTATDDDNLPADLWLSIESGTNYTVTVATGPTPTIMPAANHFGPLTVNVRVTDLTTQSAPFALPVTLTAVPDAPTFTSVAPITGAQGAAYAYLVTTADVDTGETRAITAPAKPAWLALTDAGNGTATLSGTPGPGDVGAHNVTLEVRDANNLVGSQTFAISVAGAGAGPDANDPPSFSSTAVVTATAGTAFSYSVTTSDPDTGDTRTITATTIPSWLTLTDSGDGTATLAGTPAAADVGSNTVALRVADAAGANATQTFAIDVVAASAARSGSIGGGGGSVGLIEVLMLLTGLGGALRLAGGRPGLRERIQRNNAVSTASAMRL
jgi:hypothetical protein